MLNVGLTPFSRFVQNPRRSALNVEIVYTRGTPDTLRIRVSGDESEAYDEFVGLTKLQLDGVDVTPTEAMESPELAVNQIDVATTGSNQNVTGMTGPVTVGRVYRLRHRVAEASAFTNVFPSTSSPWLQPPSPAWETGAGEYIRFLPAVRTTTTRLFSTNGTGTNTEISCKAVEWNYTVPGSNEGNFLDFVLRVGSLTIGRRLQIPIAGEIYVSPNGSDLLGNGAERSPYRTPGYATSVAQPGDDIFLARGVYEPFEVLSSGTSGNLITIKTKPEDRHMAVIRGELLAHAAQGGEGSLLPEAFRDGIRIAAKDYIRIEGLKIEWVWRHGIFIVGVVSEQHGHHEIVDNLVQDVGRSGIYAGGTNSDTPIPDTETTNLRTIDITVQGNEVTRTNLEIDQQGYGNVEAISFAASLDGGLIKANYVHDTLQYGIDVKAGCRNVIVEDNLVVRTNRHGIYVDAGKRFCTDIIIRRNMVHGSRHGIVLARENGDVVNTFLVLDNIDIYNNLLWDINQILIYFHRHPGDIDSGIIRNIRCRFNTCVNGNRDGGFKEINIDSWANSYSTATMTGNDFSGNLFASDKTADLAVDLSPTGWAAADNFNVVNGVSTPLTPEEIFEKYQIENPNFALLPASAARDFVNGTTFASAPFDEDYSGVIRSTPTCDAGAFEAT